MSVQLSNREGWSKMGAAVATGGMALYAVFAPHSIAAAEISLAIAAGGWLVRTVASRSAGFQRTKFDLPLLFFFLWTILSALLSAEPRISVAKLQSTCVIFLFYLTQAIVTRRTAVWLVILMILSGAAGTTFSLYDLLRGRGIVVDSITPASPLHEARIQPGDAIWRIGGKRIYTVADADQAIRNAPANSQLIVSVISQGEHQERPGLIVTEAVKAQVSPAGISGTRSTHRFRASGWTRHYETYAEILQLIAQLALGLALAHYMNHGLNRWARLGLVATALLALGIALTAMRTALIAFVTGMLVIAIRSLKRRGRTVVVSAAALLLAVGATVVYQTRAQQALWLKDPSSSLRVQVAKIGLARIALHPVFGHGMDSMQVHWNEWGFPGSDMLHLHSTPLQLAFDRGLPALVFWLWILWLFWRTVSENEKRWRESSDTNRHGLLLGATGALTGFFASSLVNYNLGDGEVALVFWWLLGMVVVLTRVGETATGQPT